MASISIEEYRKAVKALEEAINLTLSTDKDSESFKLNRDGTIQRFEFCVELAWKIAAKELGSSSRSPKPVLREMLQSNLITDFDMWFSFIEARNKSSHTYDEVLADQVFQVVQSFLPYGQKLLEKLKNL